MYFAQIWYMGALWTRGGRGKIAINIRHAFAGALCIPEPTEFLKPIWPTAGQQNSGFCCHRFEMK